MWPVRSSINLRLAAIKKLVTEAADNALLALEIAAPIEPSAVLSARG